MGRNRNNKKKGRRGGNRFARHYSPVVSDAEVRGIQRQRSDEATMREIGQQARRIAQKSQLEDECRPVREVFISNIQYSVNAAELVDFVSSLLPPHEKVRHCKIIPRRQDPSQPPGTLHSSGKATVSFYSDTAVESLLHRIDNQKLKGRRMYVQPRPPVQGMPYACSGLFSYPCQQMAIGCGHAGSSSGSDQTSPGSSEHNRPFTMRPHWQTARHVHLEINSRQRFLSVHFESSDSTKHKAECKVKNIKDCMVERLADSNAIAVVLVLRNPMDLYRQQSSRRCGSGSSGTDQDMASLIAGFASVFSRGAGPFVWDAESDTDDDWVKTTEINPQLAFGDSLVWRLVTAGFTVRPKGRSAGSQKPLLDVLVQFRLLDNPPLYSSSIRISPNSSRRHLVGDREPVNVLLKALPLTVAMAVESLLAAAGICTSHSVADIASLVTSCRQKLLAEDSQSIIAALLSLAADGMALAPENLCSAFQCRLAVILDTEKSQSVLSDTDEDYPNSDSTTTDELPPRVSVQRVCVTPLRVNVQLPEMQVTNRVIRNYHQLADCFLRVQFTPRQDQGGILGPGESEDIYTRVEEVIIHGLQIGGRHFEFLAFSTSQLRETSCWMLHPSMGVAADDIRRWMGDFRAITNPGKYVARMGQCFSTTHEVVKKCSSSRMVCREVPDVERGGYCFSDGVGTMSKELAATAWKSVERQDWSIDSMPAIGNRNMNPVSAMQIRYKGYKGVLCCDCQLAGLQMLLRPSMRKFDCPSSDALEVVRFARHNPGHLNRQIILLLTAHGASEQHISRLQEQTVRRLNRIVLDGDAAQAFLHETGCVTSEWGGAVSRMLELGMTLADPVLEQYMKALRADYIRGLVMKARIPCPKSARLMGVMDEYGYLQYGQVFIQLERKQDNAKEIIQGPVAVLKNPCFHPGDSRRLEAVNVPGLAHLFNVLVFPQAGPRPHPDECSGSDLDGDEYFVTWDAALVPARNTAPMDYTPKTAACVTNREVTVDDVAKFFVDHAKNASLGQIANAHLAIADRSPDGIWDAKCIKLAMQHSVAVDFPKTGVPAQLTRELRPETYPDFMEKKHKESHRSEKLIGRLYRSAKRVSEVLPASNSDVSGRLRSACEANRCPLSPEEKTALREMFDDRLLCDGFEYFLEAAYQLRNTYNSHMWRIMNHYGVYNEGELLSGSISKFYSSRYRKARGGNSFQVKERIKDELKEMCRDIYMQGFGSLIEDSSSTPQQNGESPAVELFRESLQMASACYYATYHPDADNLDRLFSFPWIAVNHLATIHRTCSH